MDDGERKAERHAIGDPPQGASGRSLREPVAAPLEDREVGHIPEHHAEAVRHAVVLGMGFRPPGRGVGDAPPLSAHDARLDKAMGRVEGRRSTDVSSSLHSRSGFDLHHLGGGSPQDYSPNVGEYEFA